MAKKRIKVKPGDVFRIALDDSRFCYGQVAYFGRLSYCLVTYDVISDAVPPLEWLVAQPVVFLIETIIVELEDGVWEIVGNTGVPAYLVDYITSREFIIGSLNINGMRVISYEGKTLRNATARDSATLSHQWSSSPGYLTQAIEWKYANGPWDPVFDRISYQGPRPKDSASVVCVMPSADEEEEGPEDHAVYIYLKLSDTGFGTERERMALMKVEKAVEAYLDAHPEIGEHDGNEIGGGFYTIYCYGPDADRLYGAILPVLRRHLFPTGLTSFFKSPQLPEGSYVMLQYGEDDAEEKEIPLA